jgi:hypothetical protein
MYLSLITQNAAIAYNYNQSPEDWSTGNSRNVVCTSDYGQCPVQYSYNESIAVTHGAAHYIVFLLQLTAMSLCKGRKHFASDLLTTR